MCRTQPTTPYKHQILSARNILIYECYFIVRYFYVISDLLGSDSDDEPRANTISMHSLSHNHPLPMKKSQAAHVRFQKPSRRRVSSRNEISTGLRTRATSEKHVSNDDQSLYRNFMSSVYGMSGLRTRALSIRII